MAASSNAMAAKLPIRESVHVYNLQLVYVWHRNVFEMQPHTMQAPFATGKHLGSVAIGVPRVPRWTPYRRKLVSRALMKQCVELICTESIRTAEVCTVTFAAISAVHSHAVGCLAEAFLRAPTWFTAVNALVTQSVELDCPEPIRTAEVYTSRALQCACAHFNVQLQCCLPAVPADASR